MVLDMLPILTGEKSKIDFNFDVELTEDNVVSQSFPDMQFISPISVVGYVKNMSDYMFLHEDVSLKYKTNCARCAEPVESEVSFSFERDIATGGVSEENDDYLFIKDKKLDLNNPTEEQLLVELPLKTLCREDCAGMCSKCGKNLNYGKCDCKQTVGDPRLQILRELIK